MRVQARIVGKDKISKKLRALPDAIAKPVRDSIAAGALLVEAEAKRSVQRGPKTGRWYQKYNPRRRHRASAPGQAPATDTGYLAARIVHVIDPDGFGASVESRAAYSSYLEFGTAEAGGGDARPFLFPALEGNKASILKRMHEAIRAALRRLGS